PLRIELQMAAIAATGAAACFLRRWTIWWPHRRRLALSVRRIWEGSMICARGAVPPYPALARGEDTPVAEAICAGHRVAHLDLPGLYLYTAHGANTFEPKHFERQWRHATG